MKKRIFISLAWASSILSFLTLLVGFLTIPLLDWNPIHSVLLALGGWLILFMVLNPIFNLLADEMSITWRNFAKAMEIPEY